LIIDGKKVAIQLRNQIKAQLAQFSDVQITLATVLVGEDPASKLYVGMKHRRRTPQVSIQNMLACKKTSISKA